MENQLESVRNLNQKILVVVNDLLRGTRHLTDHGFCGVRGRVLVGRRSIGGCEIVSQFSIRTPGSQYSLWHELVTYSRSTTIGIMEAAIELAKMQEQTPSFETNDIADVYIALDNLLGKK